MDIQAPSSLPELEQLIHNLYQPNPPDVISRIQEILQQAQKSSEGWQLAEYLLGRPDTNVRFFGALTVVVKLNTESLTDEDAAAVLQRLISWLLASLQDPNGLVLRKLSSALVTHFIHYSSVWPNCVRYLVVCLHYDINKPPEEEDMRPTPQLLETLSAIKLLAATWFITSLVEEASKISLSSNAYLEFHEAISRNADHVTSLMDFSLKATDGDVVTSQNRQASIQCLKEWIKYAHKANKAPLRAQLQTLMQPVIECLAVSELYEDAIELLTDTLENWERFFTPEHVQTLYSLFDSQWSQQMYQNLRQGDFEPESVQFGLFILAFAEARTDDLLDTTNNRGQSFLAVLVNLLKIDGIPVVDDKIFVPALDFWNMFIETVSTQDVDDDEEETTQARNHGNWDQPPLSYIREVVASSWIKLRYPPTDVFKDWDSTEKAAFKDARNDLADLLRSVHMIPGSNLVSIFVDSILQALDQSSWSDVEAATFCLSALADSATDDSSSDELLVKVFGSSLFDLLRQGQAVVPSRARRTCLVLIERYSEYFARHEPFLGPALNLLFSAIEDHQLANSASKTVFTLCSSCRSSLTSEVEGFIAHYSSLRSRQVFDSITEERVMGAIGSIIQAIPDPTKKALAFRSLIAQIGDDINTSLQLNEQTTDTTVDPRDPIMQRAYDSSDRPTVPMAAFEVSVQLSIRALRCLHSIAKGMQAPPDAIATDEESPRTMESNFPDLEQVQTEIMRLLHQLKETFSSNPEVVNVICSILRAGFKETEAGPFAFPPLMVVEFITSNWQNRLPAVVSAAAALLSTPLRETNSEEDVIKVFNQLLPWTFGLVSQLSNPDEDTELSQNSVEFVQKAMIKRPDIFVSQPSESLEFFFSFTLQLLGGSEPLPKGAAAEFWAAFIALKVADPQTQAAIDNAIVTLGPALAQSLVRNIGGLAARSELGKLCDPLKRLVTSHMHAKRWIEAALDAPDFPGQNVSDTDKSQFVKKVLSLRGQRGTNQVVVDFWLKCRGTKFEYAS